MTPPPADPLRPLSGATEDRFLSTSRIDRVHRRDAHHDEQQERGHQHHDEQPPGAEDPSSLGGPSGSWVEDDASVAEHVVDIYDDHGRLARHAAAARAAAAAPPRHFDGRA